MLILLKELWPEAPKGLYNAILEHDLFERWTGDTPAVIKWLAPDLRDSIDIAEKFISKKTGIEGSDNWLNGCLAGTALYKSWLKALDNIEFLMWCDDQIGLGSDVARVKRHEALIRMEEIKHTFPEPCQTFLETYTWRRTSDHLEG